MQQPAVESDPGIVIDLTRKRVAIGDEIAALTYREFELLQHIVLREGSTVGRCAIIDALWMSIQAQSLGDAFDFASVDRHSTTINVPTTYNGSITNRPRDCCEKSVAPRPAPLPRHPRRCSAR